ncbi:MAG: hypothetical protein AAGI88_24425 [Pseudomonadota bacterium]
MTERPILFNGEMVNAILSGRKTQTRRVVKPKTGSEISDMLRCPYGRAGDHLWVRETFRPQEWHDEGVDEIGDPVWDVAPGTDGIQYRADGTFTPIENSESAAMMWFDLLRPEDTGVDGKPISWRPSIHMPRWASRLQLEIVSVRTENVRSITEEDAKAEGLEKEKCDHVPLYSYVAAFERLWNLINEDRGFGWDKNPLVWVVEFRVVLDKN